MPKPCAADAGDRRAWRTAGSRRGRSFVRDRHVERRRVRIARARTSGFDLDRRPHGRAHAADDAERRAAWHAAGMPAWARRLRPDRARRGVALQPQYVCLIGVRSYETREAALLRQLGVRVYYMYEVTRRGLAEVMREALAIVTAGTAGFEVTLDLDALDPRD